LPNNIETETVKTQLGEVQVAKKNSVRQKTFYIPPDDYKQKYATKFISPIFASSTKSSKKYTSAQVEKMLQDPVKNNLELKQVSKYLWSTSPVYQNIIYYMATLMTFDYLLYPDKDISKLQKKSAENQFISAAQSVSKTKVKSRFPSMLWNVLLYGDVYFYEMSDENNTIFTTIDNTACHLAFIDEDDIWRYFVDFSLVTASMLYEFPPELIKAYEKWRSKANKNGEKSKVKRDRTVGGYTMKIPDSWHLVSTKGFSIFAHKESTAKDYPFFASMFPDLLEHEDNKEYFNEILKDQNIKVIHLKVPINKDTGEPIIDEGFVQGYHEAAKSQLPSNQKPMTNPFEVTSIDTSGTQSNGINLVEHSSKVVQNDSGISSTMFDASTTNGLKYSSLLDATKMYPLLEFFKSITDRKIKKTGYKTTFLPVNHYNVLEWHKIYGSDMQNRGNIFLFLSTSGLEPYEYLRLAQLEDVIDVENFFKVKMNGSQMNTDDMSGGRPELGSEEKSDSTIKLQESE
jgi:hypothetical protein